MLIYQQSFIYLVSKVRILGDKITCQFMIIPIFIHRLECCAAVCPLFCYCLNIIYATDNDVYVHLIPSCLPGAPSAYSQESDNNHLHRNLRLSSLSAFPLPVSDLLSFGLHWSNSALALSSLPFCYAREMNNINLRVLFFPPCRFSLCTAWVYSSLTFSDPNSSLLCP